MSKRTQEPIKVAPAKMLRITWKSGMITPGGKICGFYVIEETRFKKPQQNRIIFAIIIVIQYYSQVKKKLTD